LTVEELTSQGVEEEITMEDSGCDKADGDSGVAC